MTARPRRPVRARAPANLIVAPRTGRRSSPTRRVATKRKLVIALASASAGRTERWICGSFAAGPARS